MNDFLDNLNEDGLKAHNTLLSMGWSFTVKMEEDTYPTINYYKTAYSGDDLFEDYWYPCAAPWEGIQMSITNDHACDYFVGMMYDRHSAVFISAPRPNIFFVLADIDRAWGDYLEAKRAMEITRATRRPRNEEVPAASPLSQEEKDKIEEFVTSLLEERERDKE